MLQRIPIIDSIWPLPGNDRKISSVILKSVLVVGLWGAAWSSPVGGQTAQPPGASNLPTSVTNSNSPPTQDGATPATEGPALLAYRQKRKELLENESAITKALTSIKITDNEERKRVLEQVNQRKRDKQRMLGELSKAAFAAYLESPDKDQGIFNEAAKYTRRLVLDPLGIESFQPRLSLELAQQIAAAGSKNPYAQLLAAQAALVCSEYDLSLQYVDNMKQLGMEAKPEFVAQITTAKEKWQRELAARERDGTADLPQAVIKTDLGPIVVELFEDQAPLAVSQFVKLAETKFYDGLPFFLVQPGVYALTGCKKGDGSSVHEYYIPDENQREDARSHFTGALTMRHTEPNKASCQFAIVMQPVLDQDDKQTVFGRVIEGIDIAYRLETFGAAVRFSDKKPSRIESITMIRKRNHPYDPEQKLPLETPGNDTLNSQEKDK